MALRRRLYWAVGSLVCIAAVAIAGYMLLSPTPVPFIDALYMAVITLAGVGYGDSIITTRPLHIFNMAIVLLGVMITVYAFSVVTAFLVEGELRQFFWRRRMFKRIAQLDQHSIVCGLGDTGRHAAIELKKTGTPFCIVEINEEVVKRYVDQSGGNSDDILYIVGDATDEDVLTQAGVERATGLISSLANDKDNLVTTVIVRQKNPHVRIVARCFDAKFNDRISRAGANAIVSPNQIGGLRMASEMLRPHVVNFLDLMIKDMHSSERIEEIVVHAHSSWIGRSLASLGLRERFGLVPLGVKFPKAVNGRMYEINPHDSLLLENGFVIIVVGETVKVRHARHEAHASHEEAAVGSAR